VFEKLSRQMRRAMGRKEVKLEASIDKKILEIYLTKSGDLMVRGILPKGEMEMYNLVGRINMAIAELVRSKIK